MKAKIKANIIESYYYNKETGLPMKKSMFAIFLNCILGAILGIVKAISPTGIDNKKIIKE